jgi:hypothetical protein
MKSRNDADLALSPIAVQALPDGSDNINGLLKALLRNVSVKEARAHQCDGARCRRVRSGGSLIRAAWLLLLQRIQRTVFLDPAQLPEK